MVTIFWTNFGAFITKWANDMFFCTNWLHYHTYFFIIHIFTFVHIFFKLSTFSPLFPQYSHRKQFLIKRPRLHMPINAVVCTLSFAFALPVAIALFPQYSEVSSLLPSKIRTKLEQMSKMCDFLKSILVWQSQIYHIWCQSS